MRITESDLDSVAMLSRLEIAEDERTGYLKNLGAIIGYVDHLSELDTEDVQPMAHVLPLTNVFRDDVVRPSIDRRLALANAPAQEDGYFRVPRILEG